MNAVTRDRPVFTVDQYLAMERASQERYEYLDGEIFLMAGENLKHGDISVNIVASLANQLRGKLCRTLTKDTKVRSGPKPTEFQDTKGLYSYPDILVVCGEPEYHDAKRDVILNPKVLIEVLSESTEAFDRGVKMTRYQTWNPSLTDVLLVCQDKPHIDHFTRTDDGTWTLRQVIGLDGQVVLGSIACTLNLVDVFDRVSFGKP